MPVKQQGIRPFLGAGAPHLRARLHAACLLLVADICVRVLVSAGARLWRRCTSRSWFEADDRLLSRVHHLLAFDIFRFACGEPLHGTYASLALTFQFHLLTQVFRTLLQDFRGVASCLHGIYPVFLTQKIRVGCFQRKSSPVVCGQSLERQRHKIPFTPVPCLSTHYNRRFHLVCSNTSPHPLCAGLVFKPNTSLFKVHLMPPDTIGCWENWVVFPFQNFGILVGNVSVVQLLLYHSPTRSSMKKTLAWYSFHFPQALTHELGLVLINIKVLCNICLHLFIHS